MYPDIAAQNIAMAKRIAPTGIRSLCLRIARMYSTSAKLNAGSSEAVPVPDTGTPHGVSGLSRHEPEEVQMPVFLPFLIGVPVVLGGGWVIYKVVAG